MHLKTAGNAVCHICSQNRDIPGGRGGKRMGRFKAAGHRGDASSAPGFEAVPRGTIPALPGARGTAKGPARAPTNGSALAHPALAQDHKFAPSRLSTASLFCKRPFSSSIKAAVKGI